MPSPFPGMDPYIEGQRWSDFHHGIIEEIRTALTSQVRPRYVVEVEQHVYVEYQPNGNSHLIEPDAMLLEGERGQARSRGGVAIAVAIEPVLLTALIPEERRVAFLTIRERETREVVTTLEVLSPVNKRSGGRRKYLRKRAAALRSGAHLVELDLLRGGRRLPMREPLPPGDYYAFVSREWQRPLVAVYAWPLSHPLPPIPVPLAEGDGDARLDLQAIFTAVYDRAGYDYSLDYHRSVEPPLSEAEAGWVSALTGGVRPAAAPQPDEIRVNPQAPRSSTARTDPPSSERGQD